jgi:hypothetical protein
MNCTSEPARSARSACSPSQWIPLSLLLLAGGLAACGGTGGDASDPQDTAMAMAEATHPQDAFMASLAELCGQAFRGEAVLTSGSGFEDEMIMHVRVCRDDEIQIPLHVGENRSRTWILTRTADGIRLKHDHRIEDGSDDPVTQYGGDTGDAGTATRQQFPADAFTAELIPDAATNVWSITLDGDRLIYHLTRHGADRATFVIDLTDRVPPPPAPWGYEGTDAS